MTKVSDATFSSRAYGTRESKEVKIDGRVNFDLLQAIQRDYKLASYSLNAVSVSDRTERIGLMAIERCPSLAYIDSRVHNLVLFF